ncbi:MAG: molybdate ABC transporter substrate-binding protein [Gammaproteobacteria bacterium]|jgi:molybdate transport system substrate-binding protein|nr:molybdate ABC transporter substrate-binding protein [Gammaproteobacteria bacterium]
MKSLIAFILSVYCLSASAETIIIAAASNFTVAMNELISRFEADTGHEVQVSYGSSGRFYAQITNGAPFDVFFSADHEKPALLETNELASDRFTYAIGALALWSKTPELQLDQGAFLGQDSFNKLSMANPRLAPYGQAAVEVLVSLGLEESTSDRWVQGENITQAYQFVDTENADLGFVALSQIMQDGELEEGSVWLVPTELHSPIRQDAALLNRAEGKQAALEFWNYVQSSSAQTIIKSYGYQVE